MKQTKVILLSCLGVAILVFFGLFIFLHEPPKTVFWAGAAFSIVAAGGWCLFLYYAMLPPREIQLIQNFSQHRAAFEQLREMLLADGPVQAVAAWGVKTTQTDGRFRPPAESLTAERYQQYLALLKQAGGIVAFHHEGKDSKLGITVWSRGHVQVAICHEAREPVRLAASLDKFYHLRRRAETGGVFRPIEGNWYLWTDW